MFSVILKRIELCDEQPPCEIVCTCLKYKSMLSYVQCKGAQDCSVKRKQNYFVEPHNMGKRNELETKAKNELTKARSNKRSSEAFEEAIQGEFQLKAFQIAWMPLADWNVLQA